MPSGRELQPGETPGPIEIRARKDWNPTGIAVTASGTYIITARGVWCDSGIRCDPDGFPTEKAPAISRGLLRKFESKRRVPDRDWFCLIGGIDRNDSMLFPIGRGDPNRAFTVPGSGDLLCFANDVGFAYMNNFGSIELTIRRVS